MLYSHNGCDYDLSIFDKKEHIFSLDEQCSIFAEIHFSTHCYTEEWKEGDPTDHLMEDDYGNSRYFCPIRYQYAKASLDQINDWLNRTCVTSKDKKSGREHWLIIEDVNGQNGKIAFDISKHRDNKKINGIWLKIKTIHPYDKSTPPDLTVTPQTKFRKFTKAVGVFNTPPKQVEFKVPKTLSFKKRE